MLITNTIKLNDFGSSYTQSSVSFEQTHRYYQLFVLQLKSVLRKLLLYTLIDT